MAPSLAEQHAFLDLAKSFSFAQCRSLVEKDVAYVNVQPSGRWTCLHQACYMGDKEMVNYLLERGADVKVTNRDKQTPKDVATQRGHAECAALVDAAASPQKGKKKASSAAGSAPAPKSQKVSMKAGVAKIQFDASGASASGKQIVKGQAAVDASCAIAADVHVYEADDDDVYDALLNQTDISVNANKYYILQLLETDAQPSQYYTWKRWGRVGEEKNKQNELLGPMALSQALEIFNKTFKEKTKNKWEDRENFVKHDKKYMLIERDYGADAAAADDDDDD